MNKNTAENTGLGFAVVVVLCMFFVAFSTIVSKTPDASLAPDDVNYHIEVIDPEDGNRHYYTNNYSLTSSILLDDFWKYSPPTFWWQNGTWEHIQSILLAEGGEYIITGFGSWQ